MLKNSLIASADTIRLPADSLMAFGNFLIVMMGKMGTVEGGKDLEKWTFQ